ncbi:MAG: hypothetical protein AAB375_00760 [Patescibacteria group bacterium]
MQNGQELRPLFVRLHRELDAERLGNTSHADAIAQAMIDVRSAIHGDEASAVCELCGPLGPLGSLERLVDERYEYPSDGEQYRSWNRRWHSAVACAALFVRNALAQQLA